MTECWWQQGKERKIMNEVIEYRNYAEYKQELDTELKKTAEGFVRIGYLLKVARDTRIFSGIRLSECRRICKGRIRDR